ncbi:MAG: hypothetical protein CMH25_04935 [Micavibrio sp.]|nr:hypothetical protein [Micavibrio sp.]|tara:strand:- start:78992 stop:79336 length:345 start_codon:yes stop_codon:yes gene_type:complete
MVSLLIGIGVLLFGLVVGGAGLATTGVGIAIPMIPLGIYLTYRGWRIYKHEKMEALNPSNAHPLKPLEKTKIGKIGLGVLFILVGIGTSAMIIGVPILLVGIWFICEAFKKRNT